MSFLVILINLSFVILWIREIAKFKRKVFQRFAIRKGSQVGDVTKTSTAGAETPVSVLGSILGSILAESDPRDNTKGKTPVRTDPSKVRPS